MQDFYTTNTLNPTPIIWHKNPIFTIGSIMKNPFHRNHSALQIKFQNN